MKSMHSHHLRGCTTDPLINYLKALGVLRVLSQQKDASARGGWKGDSFYLYSVLDKKQLVEFFLEEYRPSPITAPWNGGSGFWGDKTAKTKLELIANSENSRFGKYNEIVNKCKQILVDLGLNLEVNLGENKSFNENVKRSFLERCRSELPNEYVEIMDVMIALTDEKTAFAPLMGTGGNDGNLEFTATFISNLIQIIPVKEDLDNKTKRALKESPVRLKKALYDETDATFIKGSAGQFYPGGFGGANSTTEGSSDNFVVNPWDYVLALEGILLFSGTVSRRLHCESRSTPVFPFSVFSTAAGCETVSSDEVDTGSRGEIWLPIWEKPASYREVKHLFSEGRANAGNKRVASGLDFARAVASLGVDRGITSFKRTGFLSGSRFGKMYVTTSLGNFPVRQQPEVYLLEDMDRWLDGFSGYAKEKKTPARYRNLLRRLEDAQYAYCRYGGIHRLQKIIMVAGKVQQAMTRNEKAWEYIRPLVLSTRWIKALDDGSPEYRIAGALASIYEDGDPGPIRENVEPVTMVRGRWPQWEHTGKNVEITGLLKTLNLILMKRLLIANREGRPNAPLKSKVKILHGDVNLFLEGKLDEEKIFNLFIGLVLVDWGGVSDEDLPSWQDKDALPKTVYSLLKLLFLPGPLAWPHYGEAVVVKPEISVLGKLRSENVQGAVKIALRRLKASGFTPYLETSESNTAFALTPSEIKRLSPSLLLPVRDWNVMADKVLEKPLAGIQ